MKRKILLFTEGKISYEKFFDIFQGWNAYAKWGNSYNKIRDMFNFLNINYS